MIFKSFLYTLLLTLVSVYSVNSQNNVGIGTSTPHPSAIVHLGDDQGKGLKIPYTDTNAVIAYANSFTPPHPIANGLLIFQKGAETFFYYDAPKNKWIPLSGITGPTGIRGVTGPTGITGPTGFGSQMRWGNGSPSSVSGDTCGSYYIDVENTYLYKFVCPSGWQWRGGPYKSRIKEGETVHLSSKTRQIGKASPNPSIQLDMDTINGLRYRVVAPFGHTAYVWITAYGSVKKIDKNDDYNYAKFDIYFANGFGGIEQDMWQVVAMGPNSPTPNNDDIVDWTISYAAEISGSVFIEVRGRQQMRSKSGLGDIILADSAGSKTQAHMDIMVYYVRDQ